jgi:hypothetical protein
MKTVTRTSGMRNFHLPLPEELYRTLRDEAAVLEQPATVVARKAIEGWLRDRRKRALHEGIAAYAIEHAGSAADLDTALEAASLKLLKAEDDGRRPERKLKKRRLRKQRKR